MRFWISRGPRAPDQRAAPDTAAAMRRTLTEEDLANEVDAKRAEHRIAGELVTAGARAAVARFIRRLRDSRRA